MENSLQLLRATVKPAVSVRKNEEGTTIIETQQNWQTQARAAYHRQIEEEQAAWERERLRMRELGLRFFNLLNEVAGIDLGTFVPEGAGPHIVDGYRWTLVVEQGNDSLDHLLFGVVCSFCQRDTDQLVESREELGRLLTRPSGYCKHCEKSFSAPDAADDTEGA